MKPEDVIKLLGQGSQKVANPILKLLGSVVPPAYASQQSDAYQNTFSNNQLNSGVNPPHGLPDASAWATRNGDEFVDQSDPDLQAWIRGRNAWRGFDAPEIEGTVMYNQDHVPGQRVPQSQLNAQQDMLNFMNMSLVNNKDSLAGRTVTYPNLPSGDNTHDFVTGAATYPGWMNPPGSSNHKQAENIYAGGQPVAFDKNKSPQDKINYYQNLLNRDRQSGH